MKVKELLSRPENWIKHDFAVNKEGYDTYPDKEDACAWCLIGAIEKCYPPYQRSKIKGKVRNKINSWGIAVWNDRLETKYEDVIKLVEELDI